jgi:hypothetical protein
MNVRVDGKKTINCVSLKGAEWKTEEEQPTEDIFFGEGGVRFTD